MYKYLILFILLFNQPVLAQTVDSFTEARKIAIKEHKIILVHFWNNRCGPCKLQSDRIFTQKKYMSEIEKDFVFVKVDTDLEPVLVSIYNVESVPLELLIYPKGKEISRFHGPWDPEEYIKMSKSHKQKFKNLLQNKR